MKGKHNANEVRKRKKANNYNNNVKNSSNGESKNVKGQDEAEEVMVNGGKLNGIGHGDEVLKPVENVPVVTNAFSDIKGDVFQRLGSMLKDLRIDWLSQKMCREKLSVKNGANGQSRLEYFTKEFLFCFAIIFTLAMVTRLYHIEQPEHVWYEFFQLFARLKIPSIAINKLNILYT